MKAKIKGTVLFLPALCISGLFSCNAQAFISMPERERAQSIVWIVEIATFITAFAIALLVWKVSKRDKNEKNRNTEIDQSK
jgi:Mg2+ and Co2+ transporter CorA